jgi:hypothetical protein
VQFLFPVDIEYSRIFPTCGIQIGRSVIEKNALDRFEELTVDFDFDFDVAIRGCR